MKKKFINGILMVAMVFATTSSFVSCKDNIDDEISPIYANLGKKSADLQEKIDSLKKQIDEIEPTITYIENHYDTAITNIYQYIDTTIINKYDVKIDSIYEIMEVINQQIINQTISVDSITNVINHMDVHINNVGDTVNILWTRVDSIVTIWTLW